MEIIRGISGEMLEHCMNDLGYEVVFSHYHMIDLVEHNFIRFMSDKGHNKNPEEVYEYFMEEVYKAADDYIGQFLHLLMRTVGIYRFRPCAGVSEA